MESYEAVGEREPGIGPRARWLPLLVLGLAVAVVGVLAATPGVEAGAAPRIKPTTLQWHETNSPVTKMLRAVYALSASDVWAVGNQGTVLHYDGSGWTLMPFPAADSLTSIYMLSPTDGFITGWGAQNTGTVYRWDGSAWTLIHTAPVNLNHVQALSGSDVWVVGVGKIYHYDGSIWTTSYTQPQTLDIFSLRMLSAAEGWAVGTGGYRYHYLGGTWTLEGPAPAAGSLYDISCDSATDCWSAGFSSSNYLLRWDGTEWTRTYTPTQSLDRLDFVSPADGWLAGISGPSGQMVHYDGAQLTTVFTSTAYVWGIDMLSPSEGWAVGGYDDNSRSIILHYYDDANVTPVPTSTNTPGTPTPTSCAISFTDVPPDSTFYPYVRCLACRGILGGYSDGTFRPNNNITRGQIAKIVSNAAAFADPIPPDRQTYDDVPSTNTFWEWIERLTVHGVMSGYQCGGAGEPCDPQNRPYFRWANNATRAQLAKIDSNAAGYNDPPTGQAFTDVPPDHPFYEWIQRLATRGIMGGYACGGVGEPCDPQSRPYFRPYNNVTRGQAAKIVANTFYPNCQTPKRQ